MDIKNSVAQFTEAHTKEFAKMDEDCRSIEALLTKLDECIDIPYEVSYTDAAKSMMEPLNALHYHILSLEFTFHVLRRQTNYSDYSFLSLDTYRTFLRKAEHGLHCYTEMYDDFLSDDSEDEKI